MSILGKITLGFIFILVVNSEINGNLFWKCKFFGYVSFTGKIEILQKEQFWRFFFIFVANGHHFQKCQFLIEILSFLKEISSVFESVNFWWRYFLLVKNNILCKNVGFWAYEWISKNSDKIMSCKLWGKIASVSVNINFGAKMLIFCKKKRKKFWEKCWLFH